MIAIKQNIRCVMALTLLLIVSLNTAPSYAKGIRNFNRIATEDNAAFTSALPPVLSNQDANVLVEQLIQAWNSGRLREKLSDQFFDAARLLDTLAIDVPRDARIRLLGLRQVRTLSSEIINDPQFGEVQVSQISAIALTQLEFNNAATGKFERLEGENEFLLSVKQRVLP